MIDLSFPSLPNSMAEMGKGGDTGDISLLFFVAGANFWAILAILGHFWAIFSHFGSFLGHFFVLIFLAKTLSLLFLLLFASLCCC